MKQIIFLGCLGFMGAVMAAPVIEVTNVKQDGSRLVTVNYTLSGEDAIVTLDVQTNYLGASGAEWASIGPENFVNAVGDLNRVVKMGTARRITWQPTQSWPDHTVAQGNMRFQVSAWALSNPPDYMVVDLCVSNTVNYYVSTNALPDGGLKNDVYRTERIVLRRIPAAGVTFNMGAPRSEPGYNNADNINGGDYGKETLHRVSLSRDFYMGIYELTQKQVVLSGSGYKNPSKFTNELYWATRPCDRLNYDRLRGKSGTAGVNWPNADDIVAHALDGMSILSCFRGKTGVMFDLPTEAQWEFACRAGTATGLNNGTDLSNVGSTDSRLDPVARYFGNAGASNPSSDVDTSRASNKVGSYAPNKWGLYDMHGNVTELCLDWFQEDLGAEQVTDPVGPASNANNKRVRRGGSWGWAPASTATCRSAARGNVSADNTYEANGARVCVEIR